MAIVVSRRPAPLGNFFTDVKALANKVTGTVQNTAQQVQNVTQQATDIYNTASSYITDPRSAIEWLRVETAYTPALQIDRPLDVRPSDGQSAGDWALRKIQPKVTVKFKGMNEFSLAPGGDPGESKWARIENGTAVAAGVLGFLVTRRWWGGLIVAAGAKYGLNTLVRKLPLLPGAVAAFVPPSEASQKDAELRARHK